MVFCFPHRAYASIQHYTYEMYVYETAAVAVAEPANHQQLCSIYARTIPYQRIKVIFIQRAYYI